MNDQFYTTEQVSKALNVSQDTVRAWASKGLLPSVRIGKNGRLRFPAGAVARAIGVRLAAPEPPAGQGPAAA